MKTINVTSCKKSINMQLLHLFNLINMPQFRMVSWFVVNNAPCISLKRFLLQVIHSCPWARRHASLYISPYVSYTSGYTKPPVFILTFVHQASCTRVRFLLPNVASQRNNPLNSLVAQIMRNPVCGLYVKPSSIDIS